MVTSWDLADGAPVCFFKTNISLILEMWNSTYVTQAMTQQIWPLTTTEILTALSRPLLSVTVQQGFRVSSITLFQTAIIMLNTSLYHKYNFNVQLECKKQNCNSYMFVIGKNGLT